MSQKPISPKIMFMVSGRLRTSNEFKELSVHARHASFAEANEAGQNWLAMMADLKGAKPEVKIDTEEHPYVRDCIACSRNLFTNDIGYYFEDAVYCYDCSVEKRLKSGYYNEVESL